MRQLHLISHSNDLGLFASVVKLGHGCTVVVKSLFPTPDLAYGPWATALVRSGVQSTKQA